MLPDSLIDHFDAISTTNTEEALHLYSEENTKPPQELNPAELVPKGFLNEITTHYLPSRGKFMHLHIKRRRWANKSNMGITKID
ncbi:ISAon1 family transposase N-terminal region protein [Flavobacterium cutihirudinis]